MPDPEPIIPSLPENHAAYFVLDERVRILPLERLTATRMRPEGVGNAARYMLAASRGEMPRRQPIDVEPAGGEGWRILDGNSTFAVARLSGWRSIPCLVRDQVSTSSTQTGA
ncbi:MAG TPA: hypothetical protein VK614_10870 [Allosphingosinicella sp.]|nr:hypothetical protein [Allosphingosinicella sp.]